MADGSEDLFPDGARGFVEVGENRGLNVKPAVASVAESGNAAAGHDGRALVDRELVVRKHLVAVGSPDEGAGGRRRVAGPAQDQGLGFPSKGFDEAVEERPLVTKRPLTKLRMRITTRAIRAEPD